MQYLEQMSKEELIELIHQNNKEQKLGLVWEKSDLTEKKLKLDIEKIEVKSIIKDNKQPVNLIFEGDNYHSLIHLREKYKEMIDFIYIDPPYNTGSKDFVYNDRFVDTEHKYRHSKWLSFMNKRLRVAKELMSEDSVIFISIDDNQVAHLTLLCDEIFGEENKLNPIIWLKGNSQNDAKFIEKNHEYILVYKKGNPILKERALVKEEVFKDEYGYYTRGYGITTGGMGGTLNKRPNLGFTIYYNPSSGDKIGVRDYDVELARISNNEDEIYSTNQELLEAGYIPIRPPKKGKKLGSWTWSLDKFNEEEHCIFIRKGRNGYSVIKKNYMENENMIYCENNKFYIDIEKSKPIKSFIKINSGKGTTEIVSMFNEKIFNNSKPVELIKYLLSIYHKPNPIILDFFAGSGTTGQAVLELNKKDGNCRQFILCNSNENNICEKITYERIKKTILGYINNRGKEIEGINGNVEYYKIHCKEGF